MLEKVVGSVTSVVAGAKLWTWNCPAFEFRPFRSTRKVILPCQLGTKEMVPLTVSVLKCAVAVLTTSVIN